MIAGLGSVVRKIDAAISRQIGKLQHVLHWSRGETARKWARWMALVAASPAVISALPPVVALLVLATAAALNFIQGRAGDNASLMAGIGALIRLFLLAGAVITAVAFLLAPSLIGGSVAVATGIISVEGYLQDL